MCTRANRASVSDSADALARSLVALLAARTWAPFPLPLDRVEVIPSAPPLGKADIFQEWIPGDGDAGSRSLVVVSIGTAAEGRDLSADEIGGALAGQIERLVVERVTKSGGRNSVSFCSIGLRPQVVRPDQPIRLDRGISLQAL